MGCTEAGFSIIILITATLVSMVYPPERKEAVSGKIQLHNTYDKIPAGCE
jgi:hypothetical protein